MNILRAGMALVWSATVCVGLGPLVVGCSEKICEPGKSESCACTDGGDGAQVCLDDGSGWGTCECGASDDDDDSGSAGDDDDSVADDDDQPDDDSAGPADEGCECRAAPAGHREYGGHLLAVLIGALFLARRRG